MKKSTRNGGAEVPQGPTPSRPYDKRALSYANTFGNPFKRGIIRIMEVLTGKLTVGRLVRKFEAQGPAHGQEFYSRMLEVMDISIQTPLEELAKIPKSGPVILVANHPHGLVDGVVLAELIGRVRPDYRILTRNVLTNFDSEAARYLIPVPFPHDPDAQAKMVEMRQQAMEQLKSGGLVALFPSGVVASSQSLFGPIIEAEWNIFTAKLIRTSGAVVVPCKFEGANSRAYQMANRLSATLRQGLLVHEVVRAVGKPIAPIIGDPLAMADVKDHAANPRAFMAWLRARTIRLTR